MFKMLCNPEKGAYDKTIPPLFEDAHRNFRGHDKRLYYPGCNRNVLKYNFSVRNINKWNSLPEEVVQSKSIEEFERRLDKHWIKQEIYYNNYKADIEL